MEQNIVMCSIVRCSLCVRVCMFVCCVIVVVISDSNIYFFELLLTRRLSKIPIIENDG